MSIVKDTYIGKGVAHIKNRASGGYRFLSNCESVINSFEVDEKTVPDNTSSGGGEWDALNRIKGARADFVMYDHSADNMALAGNGGVSAVTSATVTDEALTATALGEIVPTLFMIDTATPPVVTDTAGTTTYTVDTDYTVSAAGITPLVGGTMVAATGFKVDYTKKAVDVVEFLTAAAGEYTIMIDGLNEADSGAPVRIFMWRAKPGPTDNLSWIGDDFGTIPVGFKLLSDPNITASGKSKYMRVEKA